MNKNTKDHFHFVFKKFNRLTIITIVGKNTYKQAICKCDCGNIKAVNIYFVISGEIKSCGCLSKESSFRHGACKSREYSIWQHMKRRALGKQKEVAKYYLHKGIDPNWVESFNNFINDMGNSPTPSHTIDRIDNEKGYFKWNCRWATLKEQNRNQSTNVFITFGDEKKCISEWAEITGISAHNIRYRLGAGWPMEKIFKKANHYIKR